MLRSISIVNYTLIKELTVDLGEGMNVITGETGAGKSIVIDAISLLLGERASKDNLRIGASKMVVSALFDPPNVREDPKVGELLDKYGVNISEELIITREMDKRGKTVCRVNGIIVPLALLKALGPHLMDIHGQHEHASLFKAENHRIQLDAYAGKEAREILDELSEMTASLRKTAGQIRELESRGREERRAEEFDRFALNEIRKASLEPDEEEILNEEKQILSHSEQLFSEAAQARMILSDEDPESPSLIDAISDLESRIDRLSSIDSQFAPYAQSVQSAVIELENLSAELSSYVENMDFSPARLEEIENRLSVIDNLKKKYGEDIPQILSYADGLEEKLEGLDHADETLENLKKDYTKKRGEYNNRADRLHDIRKEKARGFKDALENELKDLAMEKARVDVRITEDKNLISSHGKDDVEFMISVNPGVPPRPLRRIASGGEISRVMLSLKCIFGEKDHTDTMVFDEIDTGISGRTAQSVAEKISKLSRSHQVICITHLPQIAAMADRHFLVEKSSDDQSVEVSFTPLDEEKRVSEIARMIGGAEITDTTKVHAKEMLEQSGQIKKTITS